MTKTLVACLLASTLALTAAAADPQRKLVMQVSEGADQGEYAITIANNLLRTEPGSAIQIIAYAKGVDFLTDGFRGKPRQVKQLQDRGVVFKVCDNTLRQRDIDRSHLLPGTQVVPYGAIEIARLQQYEGYSYIKP